MKKKNFLLLVVACVACVAPRVYAQEKDANELPKNEVALGYSIPINTSKYFDLLSVLYYSDYNKRSIAGPISAEYFHFVSPKVGVGAVTVYNLTGVTYYYDINGGTESVVSATSNISWMTIMPAIKFRWLRKEHFGIYSKLSFGATYGIEVITKKLPSEVVKIKKHCYALYPNFHISVIGVEAGSHNIRGFAELGFGEQGLLNGGVRYSF